MNWKTPFIIQFILGAVKLKLDYWIISIKKIALWQKIIVLSYLIPKRSVGQERKHSWKSIRKTMKNFRCIMKRFFKRDGNGSVTSSIASLRCYLSVAELYDTVKLFVIETYSIFPFSSSLTVRKTISSTS